LISLISLGACLRYYGIYFVELRNIHRRPCKSCNANGWNK